ncbi:hypothetical protein ACROYT_G018501 [Oculina patagonica]
MEHTGDRDDRNDNDDSDTTGPFQPGGASTPGPSEGIPGRRTTMNRPDETTTMFPEIPDDSATTTFTASSYLDKEFPSADKSKIKYKIDGNGRLQVGLIKPEFQQHETERQEREVEIQQERQEQENIANDENRPQAERQQARERVDNLNQEFNEIENEREEEIERLSLTDKLREKVKAIFKKYGFTVTAVLLAVGTTIGVILSSLSNGLKGLAKGVGDGLQTLGKKIASILPGLLGSIASFVFRTAGQVISFLGKNAWLLIVGVAIFLIERVTKRSER